MIAGLDALYRAFARYPLGSAEGCPHCVGTEDEACIRSAPLPRLTAAMLGRYAFKAMTTWGTEADYKHFLPRILELAASDPDASGHLGFDANLVADKIVMAGFETWPEEERQAVSRFVHAAWLDALARGGESDVAPWIEAIATLEGDVTPCLEAWARDPSAAATDALASFVIAHADGSLGSRRDPAYRNESTRAELARWLQLPATRERLERGFFAGGSAPDAEQCGRAADLLAAYTR